MMQPSPPPPPPHPEPAEAIARLDYRALRDTAAEATHKQPTHDAGDRKHDLLNTMFTILPPLVDQSVRTASELFVSVSSSSSGVLRYMKK